MLYGRLQLHSGPVLRAGNNDAAACDITGHSGLVWSVVMSRVSIQAKQRQTFTVAWPFVRRPCDISVSWNGNGKLEIAKTQMGTGIETGKKRAE